METQNPRNETVTMAFQQYHTSVLAFVERRINNHEEAEDMVQDLYSRLLNYDQLICRDTLKSLLFTMAHNMVTDHFRHNARRPVVSSYTYDIITKETPTTPMDELQAEDIKNIENNFMNDLSPKCRRVYMMTRFEEKSIDEIASELNLSRRTVERQQYLSRMEIREKMRKII
jgi:RNA polymerase sigma factor (sigma-70 family)